MSRGHRKGRGSYDEPGFPHERIMRGVGLLLLMVAAATGSIRPR